MSRIDCRCVRIGDFAAWDTDWERIYRSMPGVAPFLQFRFVRQLTEHYSSGREVVVLGKSYGGTSFGAILNRATPGVWISFQPSQLPLGALVVGPGADWDDICESIATALPGPVASLGLTQLDPLLLRRPIARGVSLDFVETAWIDVNATFSDYWAARGKSLRHNMRKQRSRLTEARIHTRLESITDPKLVPGAIEDYGRLESAGWKGELGTAIRADNRQGAFYTAMLQDFMSAGRARIWRYWFDDRPVAVDFGIESEDTLVVLKTTYSEEHKQYSPASLMREEYLKSIFDEGRVRRIEFYGRRMEWHQRLTDNVRVLYHANFDVWPVVSWLRRARGLLPSGLARLRQA